MKREIRENRQTVAAWRRRGGGWRRGTSEEIYIMAEMCNNDI
jgi:hypothetical protein